MKGVNLDTLPPELLRVIIRRALAGRDGSAQLAGVNRSLQNSVLVIKSDIDEVARIMIDRYGEQAPHRIYFVSKSIRSRTPSQIVADGHAGQLLDALIAQIGADRLDAQDIIEDLFMDALIIDEVPEVVTDLWRRANEGMPFSSNRNSDIARFAICSGPIGFCVADILPIIPIWDLFDAAINCSAPDTTEHALAHALRKGRGHVVTYVVNRLVADERIDEDDVAEVRIKHAIAVAANGGGIDAFRGALVGLDASPTYPADINMNLLNMVIIMDEWSEFTQEVRDFVVSLVNTHDCDLTQGVQAALNWKKHPDVLSCLLVDGRVDVSVLDFKNVTDPTVMRALIDYERASVNRVLLDIDDDDTLNMGEFTVRQYVYVLPHFLNIRHMHPYAEGELYEAFPALLREWARSPGLMNKLARDNDNNIAQVLMRAARDDRVEVFETWFSIPRLRDSRITAALEKAWRVAVFVDGGKVAQFLARKGFRLPPAVARVVLESTD